MRAQIKDRENPRRKQGNSSVVKCERLHLQWEKESPCDVRIRFMSTFTSLLVFSVSHLSAAFWILSHYLWIHCIGLCSIHQDVKHFEMK